MNDFNTKYPVDDKIIEDKFNNIWKNITSDKKQTSELTAFVFGGQPGAGKTRIINNINEKEFKGNAIVISGDDYRKYHPNFDQIQKIEGKLSAKYTQYFSSKITEKLIQRAIDEKYNIIIEGTFRTSETPIKTLSILKERGYTTNILLKTCNKEQSWQNCLKRYEEQINKNPLMARYTNKEDHDVVVENLSLNASKVFASGKADYLYLHSGDKFILDKIKFDGKNTVKQSELIKKVLDTELGIIDKSSQQISRDVDFEIMIKSVQNLRPEFQKIFNTGVLYKQDEARALIQSLNIIDKAIKDQNNNNLKFSKEDINILIKTRTASYDLKIKMGEDSFSKGLDYLINLGCKDLKREKLKDRDKDQYINIIEKFGNQGYKNKAKDSSFEKVIIGGIETIKAAASIGGEEVNEFVRSFSNTFKNLESKSVSPMAQRELDMAKIQDGISKILKDGKISPVKEKEKTINKDKSLNLDR